MPPPVQPKFVLDAFINLMADIGEYGHEKYKEISFTHAVNTGDRTRPTERHQSYAIIGHSMTHGTEYLQGYLHDHFHTRKHQLAAIAFNAMMEFYYADLENEVPSK